MTRNIMTTNMRNSTTMVHICPISLVLSNLPSLACTKLSFLMVPSIS